LKHLLSQKRAAILKRWLEFILKTYPANTASFLKEEKDRFANPIGYSLTQGLDEVYGELLGEMDTAKLAGRLEDILKIRAVQDFSPSEAAGFVFLLKKAIREELATELRGSRLIEEFLELEARIDRLALIAIDVYMGCRERIHEISLNQVRKEREMAFRLLERMSSDSYEEPEGADKIPQ